MSTTEIRNLQIEYAMEHGITIRGLHSSEVEDWAKFCAFCFSHKRPTPPPASHFQGHFDNDPYRDASLIRVGIDTQNHNNTLSNPQQIDNKIVSSVRIFVRSISTGPGSSADSSSQIDSKKRRSVGGIGEVCTHADYRRRGIATKLLKDSFEKMKERKMDCSLLHVSNPALQVVYQKQGYVSVRTRWSTIPVLQNLTGKKGSQQSSFVVRPVNFYNDDEIIQMQLIHQKYSEQRFAGCIIRSIQYWKEYISKELENQLFVLEMKNAKNPRICAWISIRKRGEKYQLKEFGVDHNIMQTCEAMKELLPTSLSDAAANFALESREKGEKNPFILQLPTLVLEEIEMSPDKISFLDWESKNVEDDCGWFYKELVDEGENMSEICEKVPHLIWPSDSF